MDVLRCYAASGQLGYGVPKENFKRGLEQNPYFIGADMGSTDVGPVYLGSGKMGPGRLSAKRDVDLLLSAARDLKIPLIIGSAGTAGGKPHVEETVRMVREVANERHLHFRMAVIHAEIDKRWVIEQLQKGTVSPCGPVPELTADEVNRSTRIVGQMGVEPFRAAMEAGAEVIVAGRACDTSIFATIPIMKGYDTGLVMHMSKIIECASICADPGGRDPMMAYLYPDAFILESQHPKRRCTALSVAAHSLYEQADPYHFYEPGGMLDLTGARYQEIDERRAKIWGAKWIPAKKYTIKLEGAAWVGVRCISIGGVVDPVMLSQMDYITEQIADLARDLLKDEIPPDTYRLNFRVYGKNAVLGPLHPEGRGDPQEAFLMIDVVAETGELAQTICGVTRQHLLHFGYPGKLSTGGNLAFPFTPQELLVGDTYRFNVYHLVEVEDPLSLFPINIMDL